MNKTLKIIICLVLVVALAGLCFYAGTKYTGFDKKEPEKVEKKETEKDSDKEVKLDLDSEEVEEAKELMPFELCYGLAVDLNGKSRTLDDLTDKEKMSIVISYYTDKLFEQDTDEGYSLILEEKDFKYLFEDISFVDNLKNSGNISLDERRVSFKDDKVIFTGNPTGCTTSEHKGYELVLYDAYKKDNILKLVYAYPYEDIYYDEKKDDLATDFYINKEGKNPLYVDSKYSDDKQGYDVDWSKFNKYEIVIDTANDNLRLQEINFIEVK